MTQQIGPDEAVRAAIVAARAAAPRITQDWHASPAYRALAEAFAGDPGDDPEPAAAMAEALFARRGWLEELLEPLRAALIADPLYEPPLRVRGDAARAMLTLHQCAAATVTATVVLPQRGRAAAPAAVIVPGRMRVTCHMRAGGARLERWRAEPVAADFSAATAGACAALAPITLADGMVCRVDGRTEAQALTGATGAMLSVTALLHAGAASLMREYRTTDGKLLRVASADEDASRAEMLLALLRAAGRTDAGEAFAAATRDRAFQLRWAAMREWLALDARAALPHLAAMARDDAHPELRAAAATTLARIAPRPEAAWPA